MQGEKGSQDSGRRPYLGQHGERPVKPSAFGKSRTEEGPEKRAGRPNNGVNQEMRHRCGAYGQQPGVSPPPGQADTRDDHRRV